MALRSTVLVLLPRSHCTLSIALSDGSHNSRNALPQTELGLGIALSNVHQPCECHVNVNAMSEEQPHGCMYIR